MMGTQGVVAPKPPCAALETRTSIPGQFLTFAVSTLKELKSENIKVH